MSSTCLQVFCLRYAVPLIDCYLTKSHSFRRDTVINYLQVITDGYIKSTESINCHSAIALPEYLLSFIYSIFILFHGQVRILRHIKKSFPVINIHSVKINLFSSPPKTKQFSLHLCPCISNDLSLGGALATVSEYYQTHILPQAIKISPKKSLISGKELEPK